MSAATAKLKKQALQHEHDRQHDKALALYTRLLDESSPGDEEVDVALFNRAGDLALRAGDTARAVSYYERAVDLYAAGGLLNNAIALCNKVLRHAPDHVSAHFTLGVLHAKQGFRGDAKHHFVEYAERMHRAGRDDEALRALREFADLCAAGDDAREMLAQHLARAGRGGSASATLQAVFDAQLPAQRPEAAPAAAQAASRTDEQPAARDAGALVFLDLSGASEPADDEPTELGPIGGVALDGFEGTSWSDDDTIGLPASFAVESDAPARPAMTYASALPGELGMLELPLSWEPAASTLVLDLEEPAAEELPVGAPVAAAGLTFLTDDEPTDLARTPALALDAAPALLDLDLDAPAGDEVLDLADMGAPAPAAAAPVAAFAPAAPAPASGDYVDLGDWLRETEAPRSTRMVTAEPSQTGDEEADFQRMLDAFKAGVERNIEDEDFDSHYDLGVAFREMGLLEEAATQFQRASRAPGRPLRALEALGQCLIDLDHPELAVEALRRGVEDEATGSGPLPDQQLVGVIYLLGVASEQTQRSDAACAYYRRVLATDLQFRDAAKRLAQLSAPPR